MDEDFEDLPEVPSYQRQPKKNKNKNSKSSNGYYPWFLNIGRRKFFQLYGRQYNPDVEDDKMLITEIWQAERDPYVREYKMLRGKLKGVFGALNIDEIEIEGSTRSAIRTSNDNRPPIFPLPVRACLPSFASYESLDRHQRTITGERDMLDRLRFFDAQKTDFASIALQVVAVFPYTVALSTSNEVLVYPAEIAVTHYNLENGVTASFSKLIKFYPKLFYGTGVPPWDQDNVASQAASLDVSLKEPQGVSPSEVWRLLMERRNYRSITICDENDIWLVDRALHFLACTAGHEEVAVHRELMNAIVTAQDLIAALASHHDRVSGNSVQKILTRERINQEFKRLRETTSCCSYHEKKPPTHPSRQLCAVAKTALLIDAISTLCYSGNLNNFREHYEKHPEVHSVGVVDVVVESSTDPEGDDGEENFLGSAASAASHPKFSCGGFKLCYEVVKDSDRIFPCAGNVRVNLTDTISCMLRQTPGLRGNYL